MCETVTQCCCVTSIIFITFYILLLTLNYHIESIIDSYHERNIKEHCSSLLEIDENDNYPFNEIHEIISNEYYQYHYYERNSNKFNYNDFQNNICNKIKYDILKQTDDDPLQSNFSLKDDNKNNKEIVHETYECNDNSNECNHCIYF